MAASASAGASAVRAVPTAAAHAAGGRRGASGVAVRAHGWRADAARSAGRAGRQLRWVVGPDSAPDATARAPQPSALGAAARSTSDAQGRATARLLARRGGVVLNVLFGGPADAHAAGPHDGGVRLLSTHARTFSTPIAPCLLRTSRLTPLSRAERACPRPWRTAGRCGVPNRRKRGASRLGARTAASRVRASLRRQHQRRGGGRHRPASRRASQAARRTKIMIRGVR